MQLEQERFEAWLFAQPPERVIESASYNSCFLCSFLKETAQCVKPSFGWFNWSTERDPFLTWYIPIWATHLVNNGLPRIMTCAQMQTRYIALFGDPRINLPSVPELVVKPELVSAS